MKLTCVLQALVKKKKFSNEKCKIKLNRCRDDVTC